MMALMLRLHPLFLPSNQKSVLLNGRVEVTRIRVQLDRNVKKRIALHTATLCKFL